MRWEINEHTLYGINCFTELLISWIVTNSLQIPTYIYNELLLVCTHIFMKSFRYICINVLCLYAINNWVCGLDATFIEGFIHPFPGVAYMRRWTGSSLVQVMACRLFVPTHYLNQFCFIVILTPQNKFQWNLDENSIPFIQENAFEIVLRQNGGHFCPSGDE